MICRFTAIDAPARSGVAAAVRVEAARQATTHERANRASTAAMAQPGPRNATLA